MRLQVELFMRLEDNFNIKVKNEIFVGFVLKTCCNEIQT